MPRFALLLLLLAPFAAGQSRFSTKLAQIEAQVERGEGLEAREKLFELLEANKDSKHVAHEYLRVRQVLWQTAFDATYDGPTINDLLVGERLEDDKDHVRLRLRLDDGEWPTVPTYLDGSPGIGGLLWSDERWWYPVPFAGPGVLTLKGTVPEQEEEDTATQTLATVLSVGTPGGAHTRWNVAIGKPASGEEPIRAWSVGTRRDKLLDEASDRVLEPGEEYELEVRVTKKRLFLRSKGETLLYTPRPEGPYGQFGWANLPGLEELYLEGQLDREWLEALPARHRNVARDAWYADPFLQAARTERPVDGVDRVGMPAWVESLHARTEPPWPEGTVGEDLEEAVELVNQGESEQALEYLDACGFDLGVLWHADWIRAAAHGHLGNSQECLDALVPVLALTPEYERAVDLRSQALTSLGTHKIVLFLESENYQGLLDWLEGDEGKELHEGARQTYLGRAFAGLERFQESERAYLAAQAILPEQPYIPRELGVTLWNMGRFADAMAYLEPYTKKIERTAILMATFEARTGRVDAARARIEAAAARGWSNPEWAEAVLAVREVDQAPEIEGAELYEGEDCVVLTVLPKRHAKAAVRTFDETRAMVEHFIGEIMPEGDVFEPIPVHIFHSPEAFHRYRGQALGSPREALAGLHSSQHWQVIVQWHLEKRSLRTVRHEAVHNFMYRRYGYLPRWVQEGFASYLEHAMWDDEELEFQAGRFRRLGELVDEDGWTPLEELFLLEDEFYGENAPGHYAQAMALFHYFLEGRGDDRALWNDFVQWMDELSPNELGERLLARVPALDELLREHVAVLGS